MFRLLVVDDESIIADGLSEVLQSVTEVELDVYKAYSGDEAVRLFDRTRFDIVLTDIRMPGLDGLQLLEKIREIWPKCRVIFLTGYHEFNYVYTAIQHEGVHYLLKTEGYDKVIQTVLQTAGEIEAEWRAEALLKQAQEQSEMARELLRKDYVSAILKEQFDSREIDRQQFEELGIPLQADAPVLMLLGRINHTGERVAFAEKSRQLYRIRLVAGSYLSAQAVFVGYANDNLDLVWLIQPLRADEADPEGGRGLWNRLLTFLRGSLELVQAACREAEEADMSFVLDDSPVEWAKVAERYAQLNMLMNYRIGHSSGMLLLDKQAIWNDLGEASVLREKLQVRQSRLDMLSEYLEHGRKADFAQALSEMTAGLREVRTMHHVPAQELYYAIALILLSYMNRWRLIESVAADIGLHKLMQPGEHESWPAAIDYLSRVSDRLFQVQNQEEERRAQSVITTIQKHIQEHLHEPDEISLVKLADLSYFNPSYLSRLFKQVTGTNLSEFIGAARMTKAKRLLENPDLKIQEVAERVGYGTATNFTRSFRKATSLTPQEYRASLLNK